MSKAAQTVVPAAMEPGSKIFVAGHRGLVGSALMRCLAARGFTNLVRGARAERKPPREEREKKKREEKREKREERRG